MTGNIIKNLENQVLSLIFLHAKEYKLSEVCSIQFYSLKWNMLLLSEVQDVK
jgi:hypothetical protein